MKCRFYWMYDEEYDDQHDFSDRDNDDNGNGGDDDKEDDDQGNEEDGEQGNEENDEEYSEIDLGMLNHVRASYNEERAKALDTGASGAINLHYQGLSNARSAST
ncbi:uncharacterized protein M421DRAFT_8455 [Didymella exigua CBS 183.55]|uniref:Uncharacterized protein n=1 Tax=Didymella exigua CBS 183.55 TaxID=1150837 RepID=A0A6A5RE48_9PLEO|nr:uncharacterized protein M421DRAFT_8455 [Didymella exigua CBS 183.55]KAF1924806.1 hypothetical protein M421DRAFT_8455 [Didymella exigua CBS 183.55]